MSIVERFAKIRAIGQKNNMQRTFQDAWILNELQLHNVADMKAMTAMNGWKIIEQMLLTQLSQSRDKALEWSSDPKKNETELMANYAIAFACKKILNLVSVTVGRERELIAEREDLDARQSQPSNEFGG